MHVNTVIVVDDGSFNFLSPRAVVLHRGSWSESINAVELLGGSSHVERIYYIDVYIHINHRVSEVTLLGGRARKFEDRTSR